MNENEREQMIEQITKMLEQADTIKLKMIIGILKSNR